jgi:DinB superfamily
VSGLKVIQLEEVTMAHETMADEIEKLANSGEALRDLFARMDANRWRSKPNPNAFSPLEDMWHLRDIETEGYLPRIKRILAEDMPVLEDLDGDRMAVDRRYNELELAPAIAGFIAARAQSLALLKALPSEAWMRSAYFANRVIDLRALVQMMVDHDQGHLASIQGIYVAASAA